MAAARWRAGLSVHVRAPGSSANLGPAFDSVGLALGLYDECTVTVTEPERPDLQILIDGEAAFFLPRDERHLIYRTLRHTWQVLGVPAPAGLQLVCRNGIPQSRGLGSSATAIVLGVLAASALHAVAVGGAAPPDDAGRSRATRLASDIEGHPDNASASVYGGLTLSWYDEDPVTLRTLSLPVSEDVVPLVLLPTDTLPTAEAREVLPAQVPHAEAALGAARAALLVEAMARRPDLLLPATRDWLHQEQRRPSFPASMALVDDLRYAGHAAVISGAGPSVLVLSTRERRSAALDQVDTARWRVLEPGIPSSGATVDRAG